MKTKNIVKASLFTLILAFVVATVAATGGVMKNREIIEAPKADPTLQKWQFNGANNPEHNNPKDPAQYSESASESCDNEVETVCTIMAPADSLDNSKPNLEYTVPGISGPNAKVKDRIDQALTSGTPNETVTAFRAE